MAERSTPLCNETKVIVAAAPEYNGIIKNRRSKGDQARLNRKLWNAIGIGDSADYISGLIKKGADVDVADTEGWTALIGAVQQNRLDIVRLLIANGANTALVDDDLDNSAFEVSLDIGNLDMMKTLTKNRENEIDDGEWTPLMCASRRGHLEAMEMLIVAGADPEMQNSKGQTARDLYNGDKREFDRIIEKYTPRKMVKAALV